MATPPPADPKPFWQQPAFVALMGFVIIGLAIVAAALIVSSGGGEPEAAATTTTASLDQSTTSTDAATTTSTLDSTTTSTTAATTTSAATSSTTTQPSTSAPVEFEGTGKKVEPVPALSSDMFILDVTLNEGSVTLSDSSGGQIAFLWATRPDYDGETFIRDPEAIAFMNVDPDNSDPWTVTIRALTPDDLATVPGTISGSSDDVVYIDGPGTGSIVTVDGACDKYGRVSIQAYNEDGRQIEWSTFDPDEGDLPGEMLMPEGVVLVVIEAEACDWEITWP